MIISSEIELRNVNYVLEHFIQQDTTNLYRNNYSMRILLVMFHCARGHVVSIKCKFVQARIVRIPRMRSSST